MLKNRLYRKCRVCGTPWLVSRMFKWGNGGAMGLKFHDIKRMVFLNASIYDDLVEGMTEAIGIPIWHVVYESVRSAGLATLEELFRTDRRLGRLKDFRLIRRPIIEFYNLLSALQGYGYSKTKKIAYRGDEGRALFRSPFNLYFLAGAVVSAFEALDHHPFDYEWEKLGPDEYLLTCSRAEGKPDISESLVQLPPVVMEGDIKLERCPKCGIPMRAAELFEFNINEGIFVNTRSRERYCTFVSTMLPPIFRMLAEELGDEVYDMLVDTHSNWTITHLSRLGVTGIDSILNVKEAEQALREYLIDFPVLGYGNPRYFTLGEESCLITIENPFFTEMLAGTLLGLYKGLYGHEAKIEWEEIGKNMIEYNIKRVPVSPEAV